MERMINKLFNRWRDLSKEKPKKDGWYLCTLQTPGVDRHVEQLYWYGEIQQFKNKEIVDLYNSCDVYAYNRATHEYDILLKDHRTDDQIIAWKHLPRAFSKEV